MITPLRQCANGGIRIASDGLAIGCCDACEQLKSQIVAICERRGFYYLQKTGYLYHLTDTTQPLVKSTLHWISWTIENSVYVWRLNSIDCDCNLQIVAEVRGVSVTSIADFVYGFFASEDACDGLCEDEIAILVTQAIANGWDIKGEGVLVQKTSSSDVCYNFRLDKIVAAFVVDTGTTYKYVSCSCVIGEISSSNYNLYLYLEYAACDCIDMRELILTYPEIFGVIDVSFGDDTVVKKTYFSDGSVVYRSELDKGDTYEYCDYRNMYVIFDYSCLEHQENPSVCVYKFYPSQYNLSPTITDVVYNGTIEFAGKVAPFSTSEENNIKWPDSDISWIGYYIAYANGSGSDLFEIGNYYSKADAEAAVAAASPPNVVLEVFCGVKLNPQAVPFHFPQVVPGFVEYSDAWRMWVAYAPRYEAGNWYCLRYVSTNKGFLVKGDTEYKECMDVIGYGALSPYYYDVNIVDRFCGNHPQDYTICNENPDDDKEMGGCHDNDWWDAIVGQYEEDDEETEQETE